MPPALNIEPKLLERVNGAIADIRAGKMVILVDDEDRENEGDLTMAAQFVTPEAINFMATHGRGLICLTLTEEQIARLEPADDGGARPLRPVARHRLHREHRGAHTASPPASAPPIARTRSASRRAPSASPRSSSRPGHVFPLRARDGRRARAHRADRGLRRSRAPRRAHARRASSARS